jgi:hypothetical protein
VPTTKPLRYLHKCEKFFAIKNFQKIGIISLLDGERRRYDY